MFLMRCDECEIPPSPQKGEEEARHVFVFFYCLFMAVVLDSMFCVRTAALKTRHLSYVWFKEFNYNNNIAVLPSLDLKNTFLFYLFVQWRWTCNCVSISNNFPSPVSELVRSAPEQSRRCLPAPEHRCELEKS